MFGEAALPRQAAYEGWRLQYRVPRYLECVPRGLMADRRYAEQEPGTPVVYVYREMRFPQLPASVKARGVFFVRTETPSGADRHGELWVEGEYMPGVLKVKTTPTWYSQRLVYGVPAASFDAVTVKSLVLHALSAARYYYWGRIPVAVYLAEETVEHNIPPMATSFMEFFESTMRNYHGPAGLASVTLKYPESVTLRAVEEGVLLQASQRFTADRSLRAVVEVVLPPETSVDPAAARSALRIHALHTGSRVEGEAPTTLGDLVSAAGGVLADGEVYPLLPDLHGTVVGLFKKSG